MIDAITARDRVGARIQNVACDDATFNCVLVFVTMLLHVVRVIFSRTLFRFDLRDDLICWMVFGFISEWDANCSCLERHESRLSWRKQILSSEIFFPGASFWFFSVAALDQPHFNLLSQPLWLKDILFFKRQVLHLHQQMGFLHFSWSFLPSVSLS